MAESRQRRSAPGQETAHFVHEEKRIAEALNALSATTDPAESERLSRAVRGP